MSSTPRNRGRRSSAAALLVLALAATALAGCAADDHPTPPSATATPTEVAPDVAGAVRRALDARAAAVRDGDDEAFAHTLGGGSDFRGAQQAWYANVEQLPIGRFDYRFDPANLVRDGNGYWVTVGEELQLDGYDETPVVSPDRFRFVPAASGRMRLVSTTDPTWEAAHHVHPQPWELGPIEVRSGAGVLGIFDADSVGGARRLLTSVEDGIADVAAYVPYDWSRSAVVYALSTPTFLNSLEDLPGDDPGDLDAVSFPAGASTRFVLSPRIVDRASPARDRLVRHELTHVAIGTHDDHVPVWLSEGLAEWVSVQPMAPQERRVPAAALAAARSGDADLPDDASFNDDQSQAHYGLAWWAVEYIASAYGQQVPWQLLDALATPGADPAEVLRDQFGTSTEELATQADALMLATYEPQVLPPSTSPTPTTASPGPSASTTE